MRKDNVDKINTKTPLLSMSENPTNLSTTLIHIIV